jgi:hypothetical protein
MDNQLVQVITAYTAAYADPIVLKAGDEVQVGKRDTEWPAFIWCVGPDGRAGWTLDSVIEQTASGWGKALIDYSARELTVAVGEALTVEGSGGGWLWVVNERGERGWVPETCVQRQGSE